MDKFQVKEYRNLLNEYQVWAATKINPRLSKQELVNYCSMKLHGELGEYLNLLAKQLFHGKTIEPIAFTDELGDVLWYLALAATIRKVKLGSKLPVFSPTDFNVFDSTRMLTRDIITVTSRLHFKYSISHYLGFCVSGINDLAEYHGSVLYNVMQQNIKKLDSRHEGGYNVEFYKTS